MGHAFRPHENWCEKGIAPGDREVQCHCGAETDPLQEFERWVQGKPRINLGGTLIEHILESNHNSWEGFSDRDKTGIRRWLADFMLMYDANHKLDPTYARRDMTFGINKTWKESEGT